MAKACGWRRHQTAFKQTIETGLKSKAVKAPLLKRINVDTTVQKKEVPFATDAGLYDRARQRLVDEAKKRGIDFRQNYNGLTKHLLTQQNANL